MTSTKVQLTIVITNKHNTISILFICQETFKHNTELKTIRCNVVSVVLILVICTPNDITEILLKVALNTIILTLCRGWKFYKPHNTFHRIDNDRSLSIYTFVIDFDRYKNVARTNRKMCLISTTHPLLISIFITSGRAKQTNN
jgi:hypothetical protein